MTCRSYKGDIKFCVFFFFWQKMVASTKLQSVIWCWKGVTIVQTMPYFGLGIFVLFIF